ncbi:hypothetical protein ABZS93_37195, partial [Streptomyces sp900116325]|uniref:hypothetical protein n=1 Tax=Streptomyces sp. 900116325 TaxID=3154295 RepID=UPI0033A58CB5
REVTVRGSLWPSGERTFKARAGGRYTLEQLPITIGAIIFIVIGELIIKRKLQVQVSQPSSSHMNSYS